MLILILVVLFIVFLVAFLRYHNFKKVIDIFKNESVCVYGLRGSGKDMLMSNVCAYRNEPYVSNCRFTQNDKFIPYSIDYLMLGGNKFKNFANGNIIKFEHPLADKTDIYISDAGVYFPSQYCNILNNWYDEIPLGQALLRHNIDGNLHWNCQSLNRVWDKFREMSERYIRCRKTKVFKCGKFNYVVQKITLYDKYQSAVDKLEPLNLKTPIIGKQVKNDILIEKQRFKAAYGDIKNLTIGYIMKSNYNTRFFKEYLKNGKEKEKQHT